MTTLSPEPQHVNIHSEVEILIQNDVSQTLTEQGFFCALLTINFIHNIVLA